MPQTSAVELRAIAENAIRAIGDELQPKADFYFASRETSSFFKERIERLNAIRDELKNEPRFAIHLLGSSQNGKSTLVNVLLGRKILTEGHVGACSAAVVRCRYADVDGYKMTVRYVSREEFLSKLKDGIKDAETALSIEQSAETAGQEIRKALGRFTGFFGIRDRSPTEIVHFCKQRLGDPVSIAFDDFGEIREIAVEDEAAVEDHLAAKGKKAFVVDECVLEGRFPEWAPQMELIDMPGTNDIDPFRTEVTVQAQSKVAGLMLITKGTQLGNDIMEWFKQTSILSEIAESTERNQQRVVVVRTVIDDQPLENIPEDAQSTWPFLETHCREQDAHFRRQLRQLVREKFSDANLVARLDEFVNSLPMHFVSAKTFRNLSDPGRRNRVLNNPYTPANLEMMSRFQRFDMDPVKTGIPALRRKLQESTEQYLSCHFLRRMQSHLESEVGSVIDFFRHQRMGAELGLAGQAEAYREIAKHVEANTNQLLAATEDRERLLGQIESDFQTKASEILTHAQAGFRKPLQWRMEVWCSLHWGTLRAIGSKRGRHTTYDGREYHVQGDLAEIYCEQLRATWVQDRDRLIDVICGGKLDELIHAIEMVIQEARGFALAQNPATARFVDERMADFGKKAHLRLSALREDFRSSTEDFESLRGNLTPEIREILLPTFSLIGNEGGSGCAKRMRGYLHEGVQGSLERIHEAVRVRVLANWENFIKEACVHTEEFVRFAKDWLANLQQLPVPQSDEGLESRRHHADEMTVSAKKLLKPQHQPDV